MSTNRLFCSEATVLSVSDSLLNEKCQRAQSQQTSKPQSELWSDLSRFLCVRCLALLRVKLLLQPLKLKCSDS